MKTSLKNKYMPQALLLTLAITFIAPTFAMNNQKQVIPMDRMTQTEAIQPQCPAYNPVQPHAPRMDQTPHLRIESQNKSDYGKTCRAVACKGCAVCALATCAAIETGPSILAGSSMWCTSTRTHCCFCFHPEECTPDYFKQRVVLTNTGNTFCYAVYCYPCTRAILSEMKESECL